MLTAKEVASGEEETTVGALRSKAGREHDVLLGAADLDEKKRRRAAEIREELGAWWAREFPAEILPTEALIRLSEALA